MLAVVSIIAKGSLISTIILRVSCPRRKEAEPTFRAKFAR